jgi:hypothetical protein
MSVSNQFAMLRQAPALYRGLLDTSVSAICFASITGTRWNLTGGWIGWTNVSGSATFQFAEGPTQTAFFQFGVSTSQGFAKFNLGTGIQASDTGTSFRFYTGSSESGSYSVMFTGYYTGT